MAGKVPPRDGAAPDPGGSRILDLAGSARDRALPIVGASFEGYYRWHAKRTLREVTWVRAAETSGELRGVAMLERLAPEVGYVFYLAVAPDHRREGVGRALLDDALAGFGAMGIEVAYAAAEEENRASIALFRSRGFRIVERRELGYREGGLGAWGLRSRMRLVYGEVLLGLRLRPHRTEPPPTFPGPG